MKFCFVKSLLKSLKEFLILNPSKTVAAVTSTLKIILSYQHGVLRICHVPQFTLLVVPWDQRFSFFCFSILSCEAAKTSRKAVEATRRSSSEEDNKENLWDQGTKTQAKKIGQLFQVSNHFHPHHLHIIMLSVHWFRVFFLTKPDHFFLFPLMQICFLAFRIVTKNR